MDYGKAITAVFQDDNWIGVILIGGVLGVLAMLLVWTIIAPLLVAAVLYGYMMQYIRDVRSHPDAGLPAWTDWGKKLADGFKLIVVQIIWAIPLILLVLPIIFFGIMAASFPDSESLAIITGLSVVVMGFLAVIYAIVLMFLLPAITINLAVREDFSAGLDVGAVFKITKEHFVDVFVILLVLWGLGTVANNIGVLILFVGIFFTAFWVLLVKGHLYGQLARLALPVGDENTTTITPAATETVPAETSD